MACEDTFAAAASMAAMAQAATARQAPQLAPRLAPALGAAPGRPHFPTAPSTAPFAGVPADVLETLAALRQAQAREAQAREAAPPPLPLQPCERIPESEVSKLVATVQECRSECQELGTAVSAQRARNGSLASDLSQVAQASLGDANLRTLGQSYQQLRVREEETFLTEQERLCQAYSSALDAAADQVCDLEQALLEEEAVDDDLEVSQHAVELEVCRGELLRRRVDEQSKVYPWLREQQAQLEEYKELSAIYHDELTAASETVQALQAESRAWEQLVREEASEAQDVPASRPATPVGAVLLSLPATPAAGAFRVPGTPRSIQLNTSLSPAMPQSASPSPVRLQAASPATLQAFSPATMLSVLASPVRPQAASPVRPPAAPFGPREASKACAAFAAALEYTYAKAPVPLPVALPMRPPPLARPSALRGAATKLSM